MNQSQSTGSGPSDADGIWKGYGDDPHWDELFADADVPRDHCSGVMDYLSELGEELVERQEAAELAIRSMGITFTVYSEAGNIDRAWPFDVIPRVISTHEWDAHLRRAASSGCAALNLFIDDLYGEPGSSPTASFPAEILAESVNFRPECVGVRPPHGIWAHICGSDLVRDADGTFYVLEDNLRVPSGVSYMLENRQITKRVFADLFRDLDIQPVDSYPDRLQRLLASLSPRPGDRPVIAVLTPGVFNSAYFEHAFLAQQMGAHLVEGSDLVVDATTACTCAPSAAWSASTSSTGGSTTSSSTPRCSEPDSALGVPGLMRAWRAGNVAIANAPGAGRRRRQGRLRLRAATHPLLPGRGPAASPTSRPSCASTTPQRSHVLANLDELVVKPANGVGRLRRVHRHRRPRRPQKRARSGERVEADPRNYVAQPILELSSTARRCATARSCPATSTCARSSSPATTRTSPRAG